MKNSIILILFVILNFSCSQYKPLDKVYSGLSSKTTSSKTASSKTTSSETAIQEDSLRYPDNAVGLLPPNFQIAHFQKKLKVRYLDEVYYKGKAFSTSLKYGKKDKAIIKDLKQKNEVYILELYPHLVFFHSRNINLLDVEKTTTFAKTKEFIGNQLFIAVNDSILLSAQSQLQEGNLLNKALTNKRDSLSLLNVEYNEEDKYLKQIEKDLDTEITFLELFIQNLKERNSMLNALSLRTASLMLITGEQPQLDIFQQTYQNLPSFKYSPYYEERNIHLGYSKLNSVALQKIQQLQNYLYDPVLLTKDFNKRDFSSKDVEQVKAWGRNNSENLISIVSGAQNPIHQINEQEKRPQNSLDFFHLFGGAIKLNSNNIPFSPFDQQGRLKEDLSDYLLFIKIAEKTGLFAYANNINHPKFKENCLQFIPIEFQNKTEIKGTKTALELGSQWLQKLDRTLDEALTEQAKIVYQQEQNLLEYQNDILQIIHKITAQESRLETSLNQVEAQKEENLKKATDIKTKRALLETYNQKILLLEDKNFQKQNQIFTDQIKELKSVIRSLKEQN